MWPMRSLGVIFLAVQESGPRLTVSSPTKRTPLWSKVQFGGPKSCCHLAPMSRYQSCSPGIKTFRIFTSLRMSLPRLSSTGSPSWARSPPWIRKSAGGDIAWISLTARVAFSTKRVLTFFGYRWLSESQANLKASAPNATSRVLISGHHLLRRHARGELDLAGVFLPGGQRVGARGDVLDRERAVLRRHRVVGVVRDVDPAEHPAVGVALHADEP